MQQVRYAIAVASGKGGVGKSTVTTNLACALQRLLEAQGRAGVGIMDRDIYGPSIPLMLGANGRPEIANDMILPIENFGVRTMSMGFLVDEDTPRVARPDDHENHPAIRPECEPRAGAAGSRPATGYRRCATLPRADHPARRRGHRHHPATCRCHVVRRGARMFDKVNVPLLELRKT